MPHGYPHPEFEPVAIPQSPRIQRQEFRIASTTRPGFHSEPGYVPEVGEQVHTTEGDAEVIRILTRVTGGRLLELRLTERPVPPFFAASHNVLVRDPNDGSTDLLDGPTDPDEALTDPDEALTDPEEAVVSPDETTG
jgi:hypothetical protein